MTANLEPSNQSFETDREATVCTASRRFLLFCEKKAVMALTLATPLMSNQPPRSTIIVISPHASRRAKELRSPLMPIYALRMARHASEGPSISASAHLKANRCAGNLSLRSPAPVHEAWRMTRRQDLEEEWLVVAELRAQKLGELRELLSISSKADAEQVLRIVKW
jgi:hypothetical protein